MSKIYFNNKFVDEDEAVISVKSHALHYGTGVFEGIRAYYNEDKKALFVFRMEDHYKRLLDSCKILFIDLELGVEKLCEITKDLVKQNFEKTDLYIRPLAFKSDPAVVNFNLKSLKNSFVIYTLPLGRHLNTSEGIKANISSWQRISDNSIPPRGKITGAYVNTSLAKTESAIAGFDEALLLDDRGHVVEGSAENIFVIKNGKVFTPPVSDDILIGVTRDTIFKLCEDELNIKIEERSIDRSEIYQADEVFLVGTGAEVAPIIEIDGRKIGDGKAGNITSKLKDLYFKLVHGELDKYQNWLIKVTS